MIGLVEKQKIIIQCDYHLAINAKMHQSSLLGYGFEWKVNYRRIIMEIGDTWQRKI